VSVGKKECVDHKGRINLAVALKNISLMCLALQKQGSPVSMKLAFRLMFEANSLMSAIIGVSDVEETWPECFPQNVLGDDAMLNNMILGIMAIWGPEDSAVIEKALASSLFRLESEGFIPKDEQVH